MKLEDQLVSLELAKEMKELGFAQDSRYSWVILPREEAEIILKPSKGVGIQYPAYSVAELEDITPHIIYIDDSPEYYREYLIVTYKRKAEYLCQAGMLASFTDLKSADARAKLLIYLKKEGLLDETNG